MVRACQVSKEDMGQHVQRFEMLREMKWTREGSEGRSGVRFAQWQTIRPRAISPTPQRRDCFHPPRAEQTSEECVTDDYNAHASYTPQERHLWTFVVMRYYAWFIPRYWRTTQRSRASVSAFSFKSISDLWTMRRAQTMSCEKVRAMNWDSLLKRGNWSFEGVSWQTRANSLEG
jgi:hypothetical protein